MREIDKLQYDVMGVLRDCKFDKKEVLNVLLSISLSIAEEIDKEEPIKVITEKISQIKAWREEGL